MATKKQQERKKKAREEKGRARSAARRHKMQAATREERRSALLDRRFREKIKPIVKDPEKKASMEQAEKERVMERLQKNAEILKALEEEYLSDAEAKKSINEALEAEGHQTLKDKLGAIESKARGIVNPAESEQA
jgi:ribosomal protein L16 Arg81 hydroxylase